jgi:HIRAN domain
MKTLQYEFTVVGLDHNITKFVQGKLGEYLPLKAELEREPDNSADENAIAVRVHAKSDLKIGYLRRQVAKVLAPGFDDGSVSLKSAKLTEINDDGTGTLQISLNHAKKLALDKL